MPDTTRRDAGQQTAVPSVPANDSVATVHDGGTWSEGSVRHHAGTHTVTSSTTSEGGVVAEDV